MTTSQAVGIAVRSQRHLLSFFLSPAKPTRGGVIWGAGPAFLIPTATDDLLGSEKWGAGPTIVALKQDGPWTYCVLANHIWSFAGNEERNDISNTFLQPFLSYTTPDAWTFALNTDFPISKLVKIDQQPISLTAGVRYWAAAPDNGPEGLEFRLGLTFLFPK